MEGVERCIELWRDFRSWDVPGTGWSVAAAGSAATPAQPVDRDRIEGGDMAETQEITDILKSEDLARLKRAYRRETVVAILRDVTPRKYKVAQQYFSAVTDTFYPLSDVPGIGEFRAALGIADRQRCILALQAAAGQEAPLAIHVYVSLMEGISPAEIANILLLAGVYTGVPNFFAGLEVLEATLELLAEKARAGVVEPLPVLLAVQETFGPRGGRPPEGTPAPARRLRSV
jgi:alkylhydroperoxidase/carboxymuconolactone decarboxylase family protein YurZ